MMGSARQNVPEPIGPNMTFRGAEFTAEHAFVCRFGHGRQRLGSNETPHGCARAPAAQAAQGNEGWPSQDQKASQGHRAKAKEMIGEAILIISAAIAVISAYRAVLACDRAATAASSAATAARNAIAACSDWTVAARNS